ncbi:MAG: hypothetical protein JG762_717 [Deferribacteraceae bacterium]|jgi:cytoskeletal protein RodZ|nr:hypothetical protein [Deferribacteraceae bacterium]
MSKVSEILKQEREKQGLNLEDISKKTKISTNFLNLIESGEIEKLPSYAHAFGFIRNYASFLKLNEKEIEDIFKEEFSKDNFGKKKTGIVESEQSNTSNSSSNFYKVFFIAIGVIIVISLIIFLLYKKDSTKDVINKTDNVMQERIVTDNISKDNKSLDNSSAASIDNVSINTKSNEVKIDPEIIAKEVFKKEQDKEKKTNKTVSLLFNDICWIHLKADNKTDYDFIAEKDLVKNIGFDNSFKLDIGNAAAVTIKYKDQVIQGLGDYRQPLKNLYFYVNDNDTLVFEK